MLVTCLSKRIGYDLSTKVAKHAYKNNTTLRESALEMRVLSGAEFDEYVRPELMLQPS